MLVLGDSVEATVAVRVAQQEGMRVVVPDATTGVALEWAEGVVTLDVRDVDGIVTAAARRGVDAILPTGDWARHAGLARDAEEHGVRWLGASASSIASLESHVVEVEDAAARRIAVDLVGDGRAVRVEGDRDRSVRRRGVPVVELAPAVVGDAMRADLHERAKTIAVGANVRGAVSIDFGIADGPPAVTGVELGVTAAHALADAARPVDATRRALLATMGVPLDARLPPPSGTRLLLAVHAEDPARGFLPSAARLSRLDAPGGPGVRWHPRVVPGDVIVHGSEPLGWIVVHAPEQDGAFARARRALDEVRIDGPATTVPALRAVVDVLRRERGVVPGDVLESAIMPSLTPQPRRTPVRGVRARLELDVDGAVIRVPVSTSIEHALMAALDGG